MNYATFYQTIRKLYKSKYVTFCVIPTFAFSLYLIIFMPYGYQSSTVFKLEKNSYPGLRSDESISVQSTLSGGELSLESNLLVDHIGSLYMSKKINKQLNLASYLKHHVDVVSRLLFNFDNPFILKFFLNNIVMKVSYDTSSEAFSITSTAETPKEAKKILDQLIHNINGDIAKSTHQLAYFKLKETRKSLTDAKNSLIQANQNLLKFEEKYKLANPSDRLKSILEMQKALENQKETEKTHLRQLSYYMQSSTPAITASKQKIAALQAEINASDVFSHNKNTNLERLNQTYLMLSLNSQIAQENFVEANREYVSAKASYEQSKNVLVVIEPPDIEKTPSSPTVFLSTVIVLLTLSLSYFTIKTFVNIVKEHKD